MKCWQWVKYLVDPKAWKKKVEEEEKKWVKARCCSKYLHLQCEMRNEERPWIFQRGKKTTKEDEDLRVVHEEDDDGDDVSVIVEEESSRIKRMGMMGVGKAEAAS